MIGVASRYLSVTLDSYAVAYTFMMIHARLVHLLIIVALLCSQMVSAAHIVGHLHAPAYAESVDHGSQPDLIPSCAVYHIHAGAHFLPQVSTVARIESRVDSHSSQCLPSVRVTLKPDLHSIRGPPVFS